MGITGMRATKSRRSHDSNAHPRGHGPQADPRRQVQLRALDRRLAGPRPVRRGHPARPGHRGGRQPAGRDGRVRDHLPRRRPDPAGQQRPGAGPDHRGVPLGPRRDRDGGADGDHQPVPRPGVQGRWVHQQRPERAALRHPQGDAQHRPGGRARRPDLRVLGWPGGVGGRLRQGRPRGARPVPRGHGHAGRLRDRAAVPDAVRDRAEAERAARRHPAPLDRPRPGLHRRAGAQRHGRDQPRDRSRADGHASTTPTASRRPCGRASCSTST